MMQRRRGRGVVLLALLLCIAFLGVMVMLGAESWATTLQRERETELLFAGEQYRAAIRHYYFAAPPGQTRVLPASIDELLEDHRYPIPVRHLRRPYPDPITGQDWRLVMIGQRISGVYSPSDLSPLKQKNFPVAYAAFEGRASYREWTFIFVPPSTRRR